MPFVPVRILDELNRRTNMFAQSRLGRIKTVNVLFVFQAMQISQIDLFELNIKEDRNAPITDDQVTSAH